MNDILDEFRFRPITSLTAELAAIETYNGESGVSRFFPIVFHPILIIHAGNNDMHVRLDGFELLPDRTVDYKVGGT